MNIGKVRDHRKPDKEVVGLSGERNFCFWFASGKRRPILFMKSYRYKNNFQQGVSMSDISNIIISTEEGKAKYDAVVKQLLSDKQFLSRILKRFTDEFKDIPVEDIENKYIEPDIIPSSVEISKNRSNVEGIGTDDNSLNEGNMRYDILFKAYYPGDKDKLIGLYINIEAQNAYYKGYEIETRGIYYAARRFSSQLTRIDNNSDYSSLWKVYSIWICMGNIPDKEANTATLYRFGKNDIIGTVNKPKECYDLLNVVILRLNDRIECDDTVMEMLRTLCSNLIEPAAKLKRLESLGINVDGNIEKGVNSMCNLSDLVETRALEKGVAQGVIEGEDNAYMKLRKLSELLKEKGKTDELVKALDSKDYRTRLFKIYNIE